MVVFWDEGPGQLACEQSWQDNPYTIWRSVFLYPGSNTIRYTEENANGELEDVYG